MEDVLVINGITYVTLEHARLMADEARADTPAQSLEMSVAEAAKVAHCDRRRIRAAIDAGEIKARIPNGCVRGRRVSRASLYEWMLGKDAAGLG